MNFEEKQRGKKRKGKGRERNVESGLNAGFDSCIEASKGVVTIGVLLALLVDVVFVIFVTNGIDAEENVDDRHC